MRKSKRNHIVTSSDIYEVFNFFIEKDQNLLKHIKDYLSHKKSDSDKIDTVKKTIRKDEFFKTVAKHVNTFYEEGGDMDYFNVKSRFDQKKLKTLARIYVELLPLFEEEKNLKVQDTLQETQKELNENLESQNSPAISEKTSAKHNQPITGKTIDLTLVYRWNDMNMFIGREPEITELTVRLQKQKNVIINGIRGIGKTAIVQAYLNNNSYKYNHIIWVPVLADIKSSLVTALKNSPAFDHTLLSTDLSQGKAFENILFALGQYRGNNLIIFDNACCDEQIKEIISIFQKLHNWSWKTIFTTYSEIKRPQPIDVKTLTAENGFQVFKAYYLEDASPDEAHKIELLFAKEEKQIKEMLRKVKHHTLLIELLAKVDIEDDELCLENLFQIVKDTSSIKSKRLGIAVQPKIKNETVSYIRPEELTPYKYIKAIFEKDLENHNEKQKQVLLYFSTLPPKPVLLNDLIKKTGIKKDELLCIMNSLKGWIKYDAATKSYSMEGLYQFAVRECLQNQK